MPETSFNIIFHWVYIIYHTGHKNARDPLALPLCPNEFRLNKKSGSMMLRHILPF